MDEKVQTNDVSPSESNPSIFSYTKAVTITTMILLVATAALGYVYFLKSQEIQKQKEIILQNEQTINRLNSEVSNYTSNLKNARNELDEKGGYTLVESCDSSGCLFESQKSMLGYGIVTGYYNESNEVDWGDINVVCQNLIVTEGSDALINSFTNLANSGNSINYITEDGNLALNINMDRLSESEQQRIRSSTQNNPVTLKIIRHITQGRAASTCASLVEIIGIE